MRTVLLQLVQHWLQGLIVHLGSQRGDERLGLVGRVAAERPYTVSQMHMPENHPSYQAWRAPPWRTEDSHRAHCPWPSSYSAPCSAQTSRGSRQTAGWTCGLQHRVSVDSTQVCILAVIVRPLAQHAVAFGSFYFPLLVDGCDDGARLGYGQRLLALELAQLELRADFLLLLLLRLGARDHARGAEDGRLDGHRGGFFVRFVRHGVWREEGCEGTAVERVEKRWAGERGVERLCVRCSRERAWQAGSGGTGPDAALFGAHRAAGGGGGGSGVGAL